MRQDLIDWIQSTSLKESIDWIYNSLISTGYTTEQFEDELIHVYQKQAIDYLVNKDKDKNTTTDAVIVKDTPMVTSDKYADIQTKDTNKLILDGRVCNILVDVKLPRVVVLDNFLSNAECEEIINIAKPEIKRSKVVNREAPGSKVDDARTSSGMFISKGFNDLISDIENRVSLLTNWPVSHQESTQVLNYQPGQEYKPHNDYFNLESPNTPSTLARGGQRIGTLVMYLNDCGAGGGTIFPESGIEVKPKRGLAVFFGYPTHDKASKTLHGGMPVVSGEKWIAVKWLRQSKFS